MIAGARHPSIADRCTVWLCLPLTLCLLSCQSGERPVATSSSEVALASTAAQPSLPWPPSYDTSTLPAETGRLIDGLLEDFPHDAEAVYASGWIYHYFLQAEQAERCCRDSLALDPNYAKAHNLIAKIKNRHGDFAGAVEHWRKACELDPELHEAGLQLGMVLLNTGKPEEALPVLQVQSARHPGTQEWFYLGQAHFQLREYQQAKEAYEKSLELDQTVAAGWFGLAQVCERLGETERAKACRERFRELDADTAAFHRESRIAPRSNDSSTAVALDFVARVYARGGKVDRAEAFQRRATELDPLKVEYREELARTLIALGKPADAVPVLEAIRKMKPKDMTILITLADLHQQLKDPERSKACLRDVTVAAPDDFLAAAKLARLHLTDGTELAEARRLADRAARLHPIAENHYLLSAACLAVEDRAAAYSALIEALKLDPRNPKYLESARVLIGTEAQP
jgi:tetratricopeptide (TPR) repeat protein